MKKLLTILAILSLAVNTYAADPKAKHVRVTDAGGYYSSDNVEDVLQEVGASVIVAAPINATYITQTANSTLTNEQALTGLSDGIVKVNGTTGVLSNATADVDYLTPGTAASTYEPVRGPDDNYVTDAEKVVIGNTSGANTGDETNATIKTKLGAASTSTDGYLTSTDWNTFNSKVGTESDPITGAITGIVKADGAGNISAAQADTDYDSSTTNEINTITGDDSNATTALGITVAGAGISATTVAGNTVTVTSTEVDGSVSNEINTITADDAGTTTGLAITLAGGGINATTRAGDTITVTGTEADTLDTVCDRGSSTDQTITAAGLGCSNSSLQFFFGSPPDHGYLDYNADNDLFTLYNYGMIGGNTLASLTGATITGTSLTDSTATLTGGNLTGMGNITGTDVDLSLGTGDILTSGTLGAGAITGTSLDVGASTLSSRALTVDTGGVFNVDIGSAAGDDFTVDTNKFVVEGDTGNVGIGTTAPGYKLDVNGTSRFSDIMRFGSSDLGALTWNGGATNTFNIVSGSGYGLSLGTNGSYDKVYIKTDGNVGIGTTNPLSNLHISGDEAKLRLEEPGSGAGQTIRLDFVHGTNLQAYIKSILNSGWGTDLQFAVSPDNGSPDVAMVIKEDGNIGIGTTDLDGTPAIGRLTVKGSTNDGSTNIFVGRDSDAANVISIDTNGLVTATFSGNLTGDITGNVSGSSGSCTGNSATATNADTVTGYAANGETLTLNTGALTLTPNADDSSVLTIGSGAVSVSGTNTGDNTVCTSGTATTAETLATARAINGVDFDGSAPITVTAAAGTLTGDTLKSTVTASSLTSVGTLTNLTVTNPITGSISGQAGTVATITGLAPDTSTYIGTTAVALNRASAALTLAGITLTTPNIGTPSAGILTNCTFPTLNQNTTGSSGSCTGNAATASTATTVSDNAITLAKMAHGTDGNLITYDASGAPAAVATGTSGQVLTSNGAGATPTFQAAGGGAWTDGGTVIYPTTATDNVCIGGTTDAGTSGQGVLVLQEGTAPTSSPANVTQLYSQALGISATGGTETTDGDYTVNTFTSSGSFVVTGTGTVEYLVVAGGGGGGAGNYGGAGGGGAGGFLTASDYEVTTQSYTVTIGAGGAGATDNTVQGTAGGNSVFGTITAIGGGGGGSFNSGSGGTGGSGGGQGTTSGTAGAGTAGQGYDGGDAGAAFGGGGGGGAGAAGIASADQNTAGDGGAGLSSTILDGSTDWYAGGGGANAETDGGTGGIGGGATAPGGNADGVDATANTGGGGSGAGRDYDGGNGGSGIVIIRYLTAFASELRVRDEAGNVTTLSPHNFKNIPKEISDKNKQNSDDLAWTYHSEKDGKEITVDMFRSIQLLEKLTDEKLIYTNDEATIVNTTKIKEKK